MEEKIKNILIAVGGVIVITGLGFFIWRQNGQPGKYDDFAKCLKDKGAVFYGAFWCSHCQSQKAMFGRSQKYLPYVECSTIDGKKQVEVCNKENIKGYPTWKFSDGSVEEGEVSLQKLSEKTLCPLP